MRFPSCFKLKDNCFPCRSEVQDSLILTLMYELMKKRASFCWPDEGVSDECVIPLSLWCVAFGFGVKDNEEVENVGGN